MNIVQITPGAGGMYCGNCVRDNALVKALRELGHTVTMVPLYLPLTLDEEDQSAGTPIFFSGVNVYLEQKSRLFRRMPGWLHRRLASPKLLRWAAGRAAKTRPEEVGELTISMLRGEDGNQARELEELAGWLATGPRPDLICLSNALLVGLTRGLKKHLNVPVLCSLQGEESFVDTFPTEFRTQAWATLAERAQDVDGFIAPSHYFGDLMARRLNLGPDKVKVVPNGINLAGFGPAEESVVPSIGYFARMCREKGLDTLVDAYVLLRERNRVPGVKLRVGGGCGAADEAFVASLKSRLEHRGLLKDTEFHPNVDRAGKAQFLKACSVFSVPALYGEAFGLYVIEALACGVPVVQPSVAAFPELLRSTHGGLLCRPGDAESLAEMLESLLIDTEKARAMGAAGRATVLRDYSIERMASRIATVYEEVALGKRARITRDPVTSEAQVQHGGSR